jgi:hypothetical protein
MLNDPAITKAISSIRDRADRQTDQRKLVGAFVDIGLLSQMNNPNNQIIFGRRGTGKTHILRVLQSHLDSDSPVVYIDARTLGSNCQFTDPSAPLTDRCTALFRDILSEIYNGVFAYIVQQAPPGSDAALPLLEQFGTLSLEPTQRVSEAHVESRSLVKSSEETKASLDFSTKKGAGASFGLTDEKSGEQEQKTNFSLRLEDKIVFPAVYQALRSVTDKLECTLYVLIDEWSSLPIEVQPYLAEFLKKTFLPNPSVAVKIASLEHRSKFNLVRGGDIIGFELGSDLASSVNIDDYYVYDRDPAGLLTTFSNVLVKHLQSELTPGYLKTRYNVRLDADLYPSLFGSKSAIEDLVRASEGIVRDLIHVFTSSYFAAQNKNHTQIEKQSVQKAARAWFQKDKAQNMDEPTSAFLDRLCVNVIGKHSSRVFLVSSAHETNAFLERLLDLRILHLLRRGYAEPQRPGIRYSVFTLDYGTYAEMADSVRRPSGFMKKQKRLGDNVVVPFEDDDRYVSKVIVGESFFRQYSDASDPGEQLASTAGE